MRLTGTRRYALDVLDGVNQSIVTEFTVIQAVAVTSTGCAAPPAPRALAIDAERNLAVVANPGCNNVSLIALTTGTVSNTIAVGTNPQGVAIISRLGKAVVTNRGSNNASIVDLVGGTVTATVSVGSEPIGVAINQDTATAVVANSASNTVSTFSADTGGTASTTTVDQRPVAVAIDPSRNLAAVVNATQNSLDLLDLSQSTPVVTARVSGFQLPTAVVFDPVTRFFLVTSSLANNFLIVNPDTQQATPVRIGINPTSMAYNFESSTLVTMNTASNTVSVMDFIDRRVRAVLGLSASPSCATPLGPSSNQQQPCGVEIHPRSNIAVMADGDNNRVLLVPLPH
jgi:YVTN family beta-propeller protein